MNNEVTNKALDLKREIYKDSLVKEYLESKAIIEKIPWFCKVKSENTSKCNIYVKANNVYKKMQQEGFTDPAFENFLTLREELMKYLEEIKEYLDL